MSAARFALEILLAPFAVALGLLVALLLPIRAPTPVCRATIIADRMRRCHLAAGHDGPHCTLWIGLPVTW